MARAVECFGYHLPEFSLGRTPVTPLDARLPGIVSGLKIYTLEVALEFKA